MRNELIKTGNNKLVGTSYYVAPEVIAKDYDERCDIWSLGVLLHVIVSASPPFAGDDDREILQNVKSGVYVENEDIVQLSPLLRDLIKRMLVPVDKRLTIDQILEHPWVRIAIEKPVKLKVDFKKMKKTTKFSKLRSVVVAFLCAQLPAR